MKLRYINVGDIRRIDAGRFNLEHLYCNWRGSNCQQRVLPYKTEQVGSNKVMWFVCPECKGHDKKAARLGIVLNQDDKPADHEFQDMFVRDLSGVTRKIVTRVVGRKAYYSVVEIEDGNQ